MNPLAKLALFGILVPVAFGLLYFSLMRPAVMNSTEALRNSMQRQSAAAVERAKAQQAETMRRASEERNEQLAADAAQARMEMATARLEQQEAARKEAAWQAFFQPRKVCDNPPDSATLVECGNDHIRAKREFEDRWERGDLR